MADVSILNRHSDTENEGFILYPRRWFILFILALLQLTNSMIWLSYSPVADYASEFLHSTFTVINYLSLVYMIATTVFGVFSAFVLDYIGLRVGIIVGAWLNFAGAAIKFIGSFTGIVSTPWLVPVAFIGQSISALAQPFMMFAPTKLAALWFPDNQRALANTIGSMSNAVGVMLGSLLTPILVNPPKNASAEHLTYYFNLLLGIHCVPALVAAILAAVVIKTSKPPTPPSASAEDDSMPFLQSVIKLLRTKSYIILMISVGAGLALFTVLSTLLPQILCPRGYSDSFAGLCGALLIASGLVGAFITGIVCDKTKKFEEVAKTFYAFTVVAGSFFTIVVRYPNVNGWIILSMVLFGFFGFGIYPICLELGVEVAYPVAEATSTAFIIISAQIQGIVYQIVMTSLSTDISKELSVCSKGVTPKDFTYGNIFFIAVLFTVCILVIIIFKADYKRIRAEQIDSNIRASTNTSSNSSHSCPNSLLANR